MPSRSTSSVTYLSPVEDYATNTRLKITSTFIFRDVHEASDNVWTMSAIPNDVNFLTRANCLSTFPPTVRTGFTLSFTKYAFNRNSKFHDSLPSIFIFFFKKHVSEQHARNISKQRRDRMIEIPRKNRANISNRSIENSGEKK